MNQDTPLRIFRMFARYNRLANSNLYAGCREIGDAERQRDRKAFFGSIHQTLNHLMVGDERWLVLFEGKGSSSLPLDTILHDDFDALWDARQACDSRIERMVEGLTPEFMERSLRYVNNQGRMFEDPALMCLHHLFNHQTHHRGQVHAMLTQAGHPGPVLDMHRLLKPDPDAPFAL